jgi:transcriptional regulator with XRE-family HTH domain
MNEKEKEVRALKVIIEEAGHTQKSFAQAVGLSYASIKYYVAGQKMPGADVLAVMCRTLGKSPKTVMKALGIDITGIPDDCQK